MSTLVSLPNELIFYICHYGGLATTLRLAQCNSQIHSIIHKSLDGHDYWSEILQILENYRKRAITSPSRRLYKNNAFRNIIFDKNEIVVVGKIVKNQFLNLHRKLTGYLSLSNEHQMSVFYWRGEIFKLYRNTIINYLKFSLSKAKTCDYNMLRPILFHHPFIFFSIDNMSLTDCFRFHFASDDINDIKASSYLKLSFENLLNERISYNIQRCFNALKRMNVQEKEIVPLLLFAFYQLPYKVLHGKYRCAWFVTDLGSESVVEFISEFYPSRAAELEKEFKLVLNNSVIYRMVDKKLKRVEVKQ